jgi:hypothetical protein
MRKLSLSLLAASIAFIPSAALAQGHRGGPPGAGGHVGRPAHGPNMMMRHRGPMMPRHNFPRRMHRGFFVPQFWWGPQFWINNWQGYGFADPGDGRWIRYYDDAYLIGPDGRIRDSREGYDWSRYGEEWEMADDGIPARRGRHHRDDDDDDEDEGHAEHRGHHGMHHGGPPMYGPGYGYGGGYTQMYGGGYGYGMYAYPIVIETITTAGATMVTEEVVEEYVSVRRHRAHRARCVCRRPVPPPPRPPRRPPPGERG